MTREIITQALESEGLKAGSTGYLIPEEREAAALISAPGEIFTVGRLVLFGLRDGHVLLQTSKEERFFFAYEDVLGLRILGHAQGREQRPAGFGR